MTVTWSPAQSVWGKMFGDGVLGRAQKAWLVSPPLRFASGGTWGRCIGLSFFCLQREERQYFDFFLCKILWDQGLWNVESLKWVLLLNWGHKDVTFPSLCCVSSSLFLWLVSRRCWPLIPAGRVAHLIPPSTQNEPGDHEQYKQVFAHLVPLNLNQTEYLCTNGSARWLPALLAKEIMRSKKGARLHLKGSICLWLKS